jgi:hypothetical protein
VRVVSRKTNLAENKAQEDQSKNEKLLRVWVHLETALQEVLQEVDICQLHTSSHTVNGIRRQQEHAGGPRNYGIRRYQNACEQWAIEENLKQAMQR